MSARPKLIALDLDGTVWTPDMYQLWGGGAPFREGAGDGVLLDRSGQEVRLLGEVASILHELQTAEKWQGVHVAWVSCTDEPEWADECLRKFKTTGGQTLHSVVPAAASMIFKANKQRHFERLRVQYPLVAFDEMLFFDNEYGNIAAVEKMGVRAVHCPDGMTLEAWQRGLAMFKK